MRITVEGKTPLRGIYRVSGNSNAAIALIAAAMLTDDPVTLQNVPHSDVVNHMLKVGVTFGMSYTRTDHEVVLDMGQLGGRSLAREHTDLYGGTLLYLAPILARHHTARLVLDYPITRIYTHLTALRDLGMLVDVHGNTITIQATPWESREMVLLQTSVTATALCAMLAATLGKKTIIENAASEPHIVDLLKMLVAMGATIDGIGSNLLTIQGVTTLKGTSMTVAPDHIEAASVAVMVALSGGHVMIEGTRKRDMKLIAKTFARLGIQISVDEQTVIVPVHERFDLPSRDEDVDVTIDSAPWPGFPTDLIPMATVAATQVNGTVLIHEKLFSNRLLFTDRLVRMGAQIVLCDPHRAIVIGNTPLSGDYMDQPDIRTGLAMLSAAMIANGKTMIDNAEILHRNFDHILDKLIGLGAKITKEVAS